MKILFLVCFTLLIAPSCWAEMYQWVDDNGVATFKDTPPPVQKKYKVKKLNDDDTRPAPRPSTRSLPPKDTTSSDAPRPSRTSNSALQKAIIDAAIGKHEKPFADDFAVFFYMLYTTNLDFPEFENTMNSAACMMIGARRYPDLKSRIDNVIRNYPLQGVVMAYGTPVVLPSSTYQHPAKNISLGNGKVVDWPSINLKDLSCKELVGIGASASQMRISCGGTTLTLKDEEMNRLVKDCGR